MDANLNNGAWKTMDNGWAKELAAAKSVAVRIEAVYTEGYLRQKCFNVTYQVFENAEPITQIFKNKTSG